MQIMMILIPTLKPQQDKSKREPATNPTTAR